MMKASIGRLRRFALHKVDANDIGELFPTAQIEGLARAAKDMQDMRECYDRLLSVAAATANSAYEFSESLGEMGSCLEQIAPHNDEESGRVLLSLGKVQFELQRLVDNYRSHVFKTITRPSESLLNDLITVEDMKQQCEEKRDLVKQMMMEHVKDKVQRKGSKGERLVRRQLETARDELQDEATLCIFRLKSLKEGQARSLLTQAARHHTAQMQLFFAGLKSLEAVEQDVKIAAERQHIDRKLPDHDNEMGSSDDDEDHHLNRDGELSFDYITNEQRVGATSTPRRSSTKIDDMDLSFPRPSPPRSALVNASDHTEDHPIPIRDRRMSSYSAPLLPEKESNSSERLKQMNPSPNAYVLPTPIDSKHPIFTKPTSNPSSKTHIGNLWHSSPLEPMNNAETNLYTRLPRPQDSIDIQKAARLAFSGPLKPSVLEKSPTATRLPVPVHTHQSSSPRLSPTASPPLASPPRLNELHQLPRPPGQSTPPPRRTKSPVLIGHSAPLTTWNHERSSAATTATTNIIASPLPIPPLIVSRSFSIPSRDHRISSTAATDRTEDRVASPPPPHPLTPVPLMNLRSLPRSQPLPQVAGVAQNGKFRGGVKLIER